MIRLALLTCLSCLVFATSANAGVVLPPLEYPKIFSNVDSLAYTNSATTKDFDVTGTTSGLDVGGTIMDLYDIGDGGGGSLPGTYEIDGNVLGDAPGEPGVKLMSGSITIEGTLKKKIGADSLGIETNTVQTLLTGTLTGISAAFDAGANPGDPGNDYFDIYFRIDNSWLASLFGATGRTRVFAATLGSDFTSDFFNANATGNQANTNPTIPEPTSFLAWGAVLAMGTFSRFRARKS